MDKVEYIQNAISSCMLPELKQDFDSILLEEAHFSAYHRTLELELPLLYDFVQQQEDWIFLNKEHNTNEIQANLIILFCEITAGTANYKLNNETIKLDLLNNAKKLLERHVNLAASVEELILTHFHAKLHKDCWKRQLGAVHSFLRYLEFRYNKVSKNAYKMPMNWMNFCLSFGLTVRECHETLYKQIGTRIFHILLSHANSRDIQHMNIHSVIYDAVFHDVHFMDSVAYTADIWNCLFKCLDFFDDIDSSKWNKVDDLMDTLIRNISLASNNQISLCLLKFVTNLGCYFSTNRNEIEAELNVDLLSPIRLEQFHSICMDNSSKTALRWAKSILDMFLVESHKLMGDLEYCIDLLQEMHRCYMVCILPISLPIIEPHLLTFNDKFTAVLMEAIVVHKMDITLVEFIAQIIGTYHLQLVRSPYCEESVKLDKFRNAFEKILIYVNQEILLNSKMNKINL